MRVEKIRRKYLPKLNPWEADALLSHASQKSKEYLLTHPEYNFSMPEYLRFKLAFFQFKRGMPLAYISGKKEFFGLEFVVNRHVLVPRPETELLVEEALALITPFLKNAESKNIIIDIGTGSGCIPISILKKLSTQNLPLPFTVASDISTKAIAVAKKNADVHRTDIQFITGNLMKAVYEKFSLEIGQADHVLVTANLPYLWKGWHAEKTPEARRLKFEPASALYAGHKGLRYYHKLLIQLQKLPVSFTAIFEFDPRQSSTIQKLIWEHFRNSEIIIKKDLAGLDRLAIFSNKKIPD